LHGQVADFALSYTTQVSAAQQASSPPTTSSQPHNGAAARRQALAIADGKELGSLIGHQSTYFCMFFTPSVPTIAFYIPRPPFAHDSPLQFTAPTAAVLPMTLDPDLNTKLQALTPTELTSLCGLNSELYHAIPAAYHAYVSITPVFEEGAFCYIINNP
jgi:hypothetical protein